MLLLITGGAASGKSAHAERLLCSAAPGDKLYLATMEPFGEAAQNRIARHRALRAGKGFHTAERPLGLEAMAFEKSYDGVLLEDLGNLLANELFAPDGAGDRAEAAILRGIDHVRAHCDTLAIVTDEIFSDGLAYPAETMRYMHLLARLNAALARRADAVYESVCGILLPIKEGKDT